MTLDQPVTKSDPTAPWLGPRRGEWGAEVACWIEASLGAGIEPIETVTERPWAAVLSAVTTTGRVIFKAVGRQRHETVVLADVVALHPRLAPAVIAVDHGRGWLLMPDHGAPISSEGLGRQVAVLEGLLPHYAEMQRKSAGHRDRWIAAGVPDRGPRTLPALLNGLLAGEGRCGPLPIQGEEIVRFAGVLDTFVQICDGLAHESPPLAIDHADIHGANVLVDRTGPRLVDWGDSCIGHPFSSLLAPVEWVAGRLPPGDRRRALNRLIDAYLEPWARDGDRAVLALATWVAYVARAISNDEQASGGSQDEIAQAHAEIVALLRTWFHKRAVLDSPEELLGPAMPW